MTCHEILSKSIEKNKTYGAVKGVMRETELTYLKISTDDFSGRIKAYLGQGKMLNSNFDTFGGYGTIQIPKFQELLQYICNNGFEHHVAINPSLISDVIEEAMVKYLKWQVYIH